MFQRFYELAHCLPQRPAWERLNEGMPTNYDRGLALCFDPAGNWCGVRTYQGNQGVVYRSGPSNGIDFTPCCKLASNTANRIAATVAMCTEAPELNARQREWLSATLANFRTHQDAIWAAVETASAQADIDGKTHRGYVYWADEAMQPVYAWPEISHVLVRRAMESFGDKGGQRKDGCCAVCGRNQIPVYGNYAVLACYNLNNRGSIAGGYEASAAHRNFPVCADCALTIADAFTFANTHLASVMAGQSYLVLPYSNAPKVREELQARLGNHPQRYSLGKAKDLVADELELTDEFSDCGDQLALALIFYQEKNASWRIHAEVQHLLPSRLQALHNAARRIERAADLVVIRKTQAQPVHINAFSFKNFSGNGDKASEETLRSWLTALFAGETIQRAHFLHALVTKLLHTGRHTPDWLHWMTRQAWGLYRYAQDVKLIIHTQQEHPAMSEAIPHSPYGQYIREHAEFFHRPELVVAFLTGCYAATVAAVQRQERGADPFTKKFVGRLLTRQHLQRLYREGHAKLSQYRKLGYVITSLDPDLATAWVSCGEHWQISDDEATFAFTIGYSLAYRIGQLARESAHAHPTADEAILLPPDAV